MPKIRSVGLLAEAGEVVTHERTDGKNHRPLLWIRPNKNIVVSSDLIDEIFSGRSVGKYFSLIKFLGSELSDMGRSRHWKRQYFFVRPVT